MGPPTLSGAERLKSSPSTFGYSLRSRVPVSCLEIPADPADGEPYKGPVSFLTAP